MVKKFLASSERRHVVTLEAFTRAAIEDALQRLTRDIRERLPSLLQDDVFEIAFKVGPRTITETTFFRRLVRDRVPVVAALRELLTTYLEVQPQALEANGLFAQIWGPEDQGALAPAMLALLLLDASAHDVFRDYLAKRDGEHDVYVHVLMKRYIKAHKWRDLAMIKLGIYFALVVRGGGGIVYKGSALRDFGLLQAAERMIAPEQFAAEIMQEIDEFIAANPDLPDVGKGELLQVMRDSLETTQYGLETLAVILSRKYPMRSLDQNTLELLRYGGTMQ
jgi:hypothetical protein